MEGSSLFSSGFLGASFNWWIGQIADDSTWRDNMIPGKFQDANSIPGWGRRYKVRIIGLHDKEEEILSSDQLPWAQVMYPVTSGGGQTGASQTPNLRQGNFVFGFFLDGEDQQVPVIMGVLGNNAQTVLQTQIGTTQSNYGPVSGFAEGQDPPVASAKPKVPDDRLVTSKPKDAVASVECSPPPPGVTLNKFGLRADKSLTSQQLSDAQRARAEAEARGLVGASLEDFVQQTVSSEIRKRCESNNSPNSPSQPGATIENPDAVHLQTNADTKRNENYIKKRSIVNAHDLTSSSLKSIQVLLDNLVREIDKILHAANSYIDKASLIINDIKSLISDVACEIAKFMIILFNKILEYVLKKLNIALSPTVDVLFPNDRYKYVDIKDDITDKIYEIFSKIIGKLCDQIRALLEDELDINTPSRDIGDGTNGDSPFVPMCSVEKLTSNVVALNASEIQDGLDEVITSIQAFLDDSLAGLADAGGAIDSVIASISGISGNISSALNFANLVIEIFSTDLKPNLASADFYTLQYGAGASPEAQLPNLDSIAEKAKQATSSLPDISVVSLPFAPPPKNSIDIDYKTKIDR